MSTIRLIADYTVMLILIRNSNIIIWNIIRDILFTNLTLILLCIIVIIIPN